MKISINTIRGLNQRYGCADDIAQNGTPELVKKIGAQLAAVEEVTEFGKKYEDVVIVKVIACVQHPNADKLKVCTIDDGAITPNVNRDDGGYIQVVCGAPNVHAGLAAAWLPPGSTVPESYDKEPFVLEARELRGLISNGMLASARELGLGENHEGILEIEEDAKPGTLFAEHYNLTGDSIVDMENKMFTHRPDCFGFLGISRELAGIQQMPFKSPNWYVVSPSFPGIETDELSLEVYNEIPELVPRFTAITLRDVKIKASPVWLQIELAKAGLKSINNIVDYTNFFMLETGQPIHVYDYDKVSAITNGGPVKLTVRHPKPGEKITLLNGKTIEPHAEAMMVAAEDKLICLGGAMGGTETEVSEATKNIIIEAANWDMYAMRKTSMIHGIFTDAVTRFNKGQSPLQNLAVLAKITDEIRTFANGKVAGNVVDDNHLTGESAAQGSVNPSVHVTAEFINARLGLHLSTQDITTLLTNVEFKVTPHDQSLEIAAPFWRTDIEIPEDVTEEVGRLYGYDHLPLDLPVRDIMPSKPDEILGFKQRIRNILSKAGANEVLTYSFVHGKLADAVGLDRNQAFELSNALSPDLQYYRPSLLPSLLDKVHINIKAGYDKFSLFEMGKTHIKGLKDDENLPEEQERLASVITYNDNVVKGNGTAAFYHAKYYVCNLLNILGVAYQIEAVNFDSLSLADQLMVMPFEAKRLACIRIDNVNVGFIGELKARASKQLKLPQFTAGFELDLKRLLQNTGQASSYIPLPRYPQVQQDISLRVPIHTSYQAVYDVLSKQLLHRANTHSTLEPLDIYQRAGEDHYKQVTFRFTTANYQKTLTSQEVNGLLDQAATEANVKLGAERI